MTAHAAAWQTLRKDEGDCARLCPAFVTHIDMRAHAPLPELLTDDTKLDRMGVVMVGRGVTRTSSKCGRPAS